MRRLIHLILFPALVASAGAQQAPLGGGLRKATSVSVDLQQRNSRATTPDTDQSTLTALVYQRLRDGGWPADAARPGSASADTTVVVRIDISEVQLGVNVQPGFRSVIVDTSAWRSLSTPDDVTVKFPAIVWREQANQIVATPESNSFVIQTLKDHINDLTGAYLNANGRQIDLPDMTSDAGLLARILILESIDLKKMDYTDSEMSEIGDGMNAMRAAIDNRLRKQPPRSDSLIATSYTDVILMTGQFDYVQRTDGKISFTDKNKYNQLREFDRRVGRDPTNRYLSIKQTAIQVATKSFTDPFLEKGGTYAWARKYATSAPSVGIELDPTPIGSKGQNQFFGLRKPS